jgi:hypothetical protein
MARLAAGLAAAPLLHPPKPGTPPPDIREWLAVNGLNDDFGILPAAWAKRASASDQAFC